MRRFLAGGMVTFIVILMAVLIQFLPLSGAEARSPKPALVKTFEIVVGADPGEDPHLKIDSSIRPVQDLGAGCYETEPSTRKIKFETLWGLDQRAIESNDRQTRVNSKLSLFFKAFLSRFTP